MVLELAATIKATEKRLPASISEREKDCLTSGRAIPKVATTIDGIRFEQGTMHTVRRSGAGAAEFELLMGFPYFKGMVR
jgi:hypothetical protein